MSSVLLFQVVAPILAFFVFLLSANTTAKQEASDEDRPSRNWKAFRQPYIGMIYVIGIQFFASVFFDVPVVIGWFTLVFIGLALLMVVLHWAFKRGLWNDDEEGNTYTQKGGVKPLAIGAVFLFIGFAVPMFFGLGGRSVWNILEVEHGVNLPFGEEHGELVDRDEPTDDEPADAADGSAASSTGEDAASATTSTTERPEGQPTVNMDNATDSTAVPATTTTTTVVYPEECITVVNTLRRDMSAIRDNALELLKELQGRRLNTRTPPLNDKHNCQDDQAFLGILRQNGLDIEEAEAYLNSQASTTTTTVTDEEASSDECMGLIDEIETYLMSPERTNTLSEEEITPGHIIGVFKNSDRTDWDCTMEPPEFEAMVNRLAIVGT